MANSNKILQTRIQCKIDTEENWNKATTFIPLSGEIVIYEGEVPRIKVGDGISYLSSLPFLAIPSNTSMLNYTIEGEKLIINSNAIKSEGVLF